MTMLEQIKSKKISLFWQLVVIFIFVEILTALLAVSIFKDNASYNYLYLAILHLILLILATFYFLRIKVEDKPSIQSMAQEVEHKIKKTELQMKGIIDSALDSVIVIDGKGTVTAWNNMAEKMFGWNREEAIGTEISKLIIPDRMKDAHHNGMEKFHATGQGPVLNSRVEVPAMRKNKEEFPAELTVIPIEIEGEHTFSAFVRDLTEKHEAQKAIESERERLNVSLQNIDDGVVVTNNENKILLINEAAKKIFLLEDKDYSNQYFSELILNKNLKETWIENEEVSNNQVYKLSDKENQLVSFSKKSLYVEDKIGHITVIRDITKQEEIDRMKSDFVSAVSHELRTPLTSIKGFASTMLSDKDMPDSDRMEFLKIISDESDRLANLIRDLLQISLIESGKVKLSKENFDMHKILKKVQDLALQQAEEKNIKYETKLSAYQGKFIGDAEKLQSAILNLAYNAIKFTNNGGKVTVSSYQKEDQLLIEVEDNGMGIPKRDLYNVFKRFFRVNRPGTEIQGTGLGLPIVKEIVHMHKGEIKVESEIDKGTKFTISLPLSID